jgi:hypothetical protein
VAEELIEAASAMVFPVSHMTAGVVEEFDLIRASGPTARCLVALLDASDTTDRVADPARRIRERLADFTNVFTLRPGGTVGSTFYPTASGPPPRLFR